MPLDRKARRRWMLLLSAFGVLAVGFLWVSATSEGDARGAGQPDAALDMRAQVAITSTALQVQSLGGLRGEMAAQLARDWLDSRWPAGATGRSAILASLRSSDETIRWVALLAVTRYGPGDVPLVDALLHCARRSSGDVQAAAGAAFKDIARPTDEALEAMRAACQEADVTTRVALLRAIGLLARDTMSRDFLLEFLGDSDPRTRVGAAYGLAALEALGEMPDNDGAVVRLTKALDDADPHVRACACRALQRVGPLAAPAVERLIELLGDENRQVVRWATSAILGCGDEAVDSLRWALTDGHPASLRLVWLLRSIGSKQAQQTLMLSLEHDDPFVRAEGAIALHALGVDDAPVLAVLVGLLDSEDARLLTLVLHGLAIASDRAGASSHREAIAAMQRHPNRDVARAAAAALERLDGT